MSLAERLEARQREREQQERAEREARYNALLRIPLKEMSDAEADEMDSLINLLGFTRQQADADRKAIERERTYTAEAVKLAPLAAAAAAEIEKLSAHKQRLLADLSRVQTAIDEQAKPIALRDKAVAMASEMRRLNAKLFQ